MALANCYVFYHIFVMWNSGRVKHMRWQSTSPTDLNYQQTWSVMSISCSISLPFRQMNYQEHSGDMLTINGTGENQTSTRNSEQLTNYWSCQTISSEKRMTIYQRCKIYCLTTWNCLLRMIRNYSAKR